MALSSAHPERVPGLDDPIAWAVAPYDRMHNLGVVGIAHIRAVGVEPIPDRAQRAEMPMPVEPVTTLEPLGA
jgi:hypothetical protein